MMLTAAGSHPGHDRGHRKRQLHPEDDLETAHAHAAGGLDCGPVDLADPHVGVGEDRRDPQDGECERDIEQPHPDEGRHERDQRQLGHGPPGISEGDREAFPPAQVPEDHPGGQRDGDRRAERQERHLEVLARQVKHLVRPAHHRLSGARHLLVEDEVEGVAEGAEEGEVEGEGAQAVASFWDRRHGAKQTLGEQEHQVEGDRHQDREPAGDHDVGLEVDLLVERARPACSRWRTP